VSAVPENVLKLRGWTREAVERLDLGYEGERVLLPVREASGELLGHLHYSPNGAEPKMLADAECPRELFPPPEMICAEEGAGPLWLVEGEPDCVRAWSLGLSAVAVPGTQGWKSEWAPRFTGRKVAVCFDADEGGRTTAARVGSDLAAAGIEARLIDLVPVADRDGFDLTDFTKRAATPEERETMRHLLVDMAQRAPLAAAPHEEPELRIATLDEFVGVDESGGDALLGSDDDALIPENGDVMVYGDGGVGKTTLVIDLACHFAAGDAWLGIEVARPLRVLLIENEGPRPRFRHKLRRKRDAWAGLPLGDRLRVFEEPWGGFSYADAEWRARLAGAVRELELDVVAVGPLTASGMDLPGTIQECRDFLALVDEARAASGRGFVNLVVHHENRGGKVSGAWEGVGDTLLHVTQQGHGHLRLYVQKARWSSEHHATTIQLAWAAGESFTVEEQVELDDETIRERITAAIATDPGKSSSWLAEQTPGVGDKRRKSVRDELLREGVIVNVAKNAAGQWVALDHIQERRQARLYPAADPTIRHLRLDPAAAEPQFAAAGGEGGPADLRPAALHIEPQAVEPQAVTPSLDLGSVSDEDNDAGGGEDR
jgi:AAA domain/Toprim-like